MAGEIGLVVKRGSDVAEEIAVRLARRAEEEGYRVYVEVSSEPELLPEKPRFNIEEWSPEKVVVVGGDGTLLRTFMRLGEGLDPLFMAVKAGKRGFLLDVERYEAEERLLDFLRGNYRVFAYPRYRVYIQGEPKECMFNDAALVAIKAKLVRLNVLINGDPAMSIDGDGVVISTTAGSTAYSLSAGGPIVDPGLEVLVVTPLNPVQLHLRPIVLPDSASVDVEVKFNSNPVHVSIDGQAGYDVEPGSMVSVRKCGRPIRIARFRWWENYYERLYTRLLTYW